MTDLSALYERTGGATDDDAGDDAEEAAEDVTLRVHVAPGAGRSAVVGRHGDALKVRVAAPPVGGRANDAARTLLAEAFGLRGGQVELVAGETSRSKRFVLREVHHDEFARRLRVLVERQGRREDRRQAPPRPS